MTPQELRAALAAFKGKQVSPEQRARLAEAQAALDEYDRQNHPLRVARRREDAAAMVDRVHGFSPEVKDGANFITARQNAKQSQERLEKGLVGGTAIPLMAAAAGAAGPAMLSAPSSLAGKLAQGTIGGALGGALGGEDPLAAGLMSTHPVGLTAQALHAMYGDDKPLVPAKAAEAVSLPTSTLRALKSLLAGKRMDVEHGAIITPRGTIERSGGAAEINWDKGIKGGLFKYLDSLGLSDAEAKLSGNIHTHPSTQPGDTRSWLNSAPGEEDFTFARHFLGGRGENHVYHPVAGVTDTYAPGDKAVILDMARRSDPRFGYRDDEHTLALENLMNPTVTNPRYSGTLPPPFQEYHELERRLNQALLQERGAVTVSNDGPKADNDMLYDLLQQYKKQRRAYAQGGLIQMRNQHG